ncbi:PQQ-dependent sugar dehydrogenase [Nonomuraea sp. NPDC049784]|uniref:PQQ-dependent sugar dehydrogenase n=1 Tax=Nonomuraea sp. NPDC049784 TaxID=3154361 RepID=UPI0033FF500C
MVGKMCRGARRTVWTALAVTVALVSPCSPVKAETAATLCQQWRAHTLAQNLAAPWGIAFLPAGEALVTERDTARLLRISRWGGVSEVAAIDEARPGDEAGLLGVAVSPRFPRDPYVFLYYSTDSDNRIVRYRYSRASGLTQATVIVDGIPKSHGHNGGRLAFGPDGYLYASTGDANQAKRAQDLGSLGGKILRLTTSGQPAPGNPFNSRIWSYGHRNIEGLAWDRSGRLYATEFGSNRFDEINLIKKGGNYGWPVVEGVANNPRFIDPALTWTPDMASPSGVAFADGSLWVGALHGRRLWHVPVSVNGTLGTPVSLFEGQYGRIRAVAATARGQVWFGTSNKDGRGSPVAEDDRILVVGCAPRPGHPGWPGSPAGTPSDAGR